MVHKSKRENGCQRVSRYIFQIRGYLARKREELETGLALINRKSNNCLSCSKANETLKRQSSSWCKLGFIKGALAISEQSKPEPRRTTYS